MISRVSNMVACYFVVNINCADNIISTMIISFIFPWTSIVIQYIPIVTIIIGNFKENCVKRKLIKNGLEILLRGKISSGKGKQRCTYGKICVQYGL